MKTLGELFDISRQYPVLLYDGTCGLCDRFVQRVVKSDHQKLIKLCPLQSDKGQQICLAYDCMDMDTAMLLYKGQLYLKSKVLIQLSEILGGQWTLARSLHILPASLQDWAYDRIAKSRYRWFGKQEVCLVPAAYADRMIK